MATKVQVIGVYRIAPTLETIKEAAHYHRFRFLIDDDGNYVDEIRWQDFMNLALIELKVSGAWDPQEGLLTVGQGDQAAYLEYFLDGDGQALLTEEQASRATDRRVCFYLHFLDIEQPLKVGTELINLPAWSTLPERLREWTHYVPVD